MNATPARALSLLVIFFAAMISISEGQSAGDTEWPNYGNDTGGMRYSTLSQINRDNVSTLKVAWTFHTGDVSDGRGDSRRSGFEATPILVDGTLYLTTPFNRIIALDPETGKQRWAYDPKIDRTLDYGDGLVNRGVSSWLDSSRPSNQPCHRRIYEATQDAHLVSVDAATGKPCSDFGDSGQVNLRNVPGYRDGWYHMTSPPAVIDDLVVVGSAINDNQRTAMPAGVVRAFDARSGLLRWSWDPIPTTASAGSEGKKPSAKATEPTTGAANAWSIMTVDPQRDLIFIPTGSASPDYYGGLRPGDNKWANSVVALRAKTGELVWGFQLVHHDLWDYDSASPPLLATLRHNGKDVPVVIQGNKTGFLYVLNRDTGSPVFPVEERRVPPSDIPGEAASPTQPFPSAPPPLALHKISADDAWGPTSQDRETCRNWIRGLRNEGIFTPPSLQGTVAVPGNLGGMTWSGYAFDPQHALLVVNTNNLIAKVKLIPSADFSRTDRTEDGDYSPQSGAPYALFRRFLQSPSDMPCNAPPWGTLAAVDMTEGKYLRAFDIETGKELWKVQLPASGNATPMTYRLAANGKQYVVIAAGGHPKITEESLSDALVAFTLP